MKKVFLKSLKSLLNALPMMFSIVFLIGLMKSFVSFESISHLFTENKFVDTAIGSLLGSFLAGNSINSYIIGKEMVVGGISLFAVTAFIISWVTVGFVQIPVEKDLLGSRFAYTRNLLSILLAIVVSLLTVGTLGAIG